MPKKKPLASAIGLLIAAGTITVRAQEAPEAQQAAGPIEQVIATGTRIRADAFSSSVPIDVVSTDVASLQGINDIGALLQSTTVAAGSPQVTTALSSSFVMNGGSGVETLSLRGLGANRTLVLLNNRRAGPAGVRGAVSSFDLNVIPLSVVDRVEILKDGASSIYGSDAIAGVANIVTRKVEGVSLDGYYSAPSDNGGRESRFSLAWGHAGEHGSFEVAADAYRQFELAKGQRSYFSCGEYYIFDPSTGARADTIDPRTGRYHCEDLLWGHVWIYDYQGAGGNVPNRAKAQYDYDGNLGNYIPGFAVDPSNPDYMVTPPGWYPVSYDRTSDSVTNADHPFQDAASLVPKTERSTLFGQGDLDIGQHMAGYMEFLVNRRKTHINGYRQYWSYIYNGDSDGFFPSNPLYSDWTGAQWLSPTPITDHSDESDQVDYQRFVLGLRGDINANWGWDVSYQYSHSDGDYVTDEIYDDSIWAQNWIYGSCAGTTTAVRGVPCIDVPWTDPQLLAGNVPADIQNFLFGVDHGNTKYTEKSLEGYVSGVAGKLPAGPLGFAFGFQRQDDEIKDTPGQIALAGNAWGSTSAGITQGTQTTTAYFGEIQIPLLAGKPGAKALDLNGSIRYTDVNTYGSATTHKVGLNWQITDSVRLRLNKGTSFRSPALYELYLSDQTSFLGQRFIDPCIQWQAALDAGDISPRVAANCQAEGLAPDYLGGAISATVITGGGYGVLKAETSDSQTFGVVWQPSKIDLSLAVDYFQIKVKNEVDQLGPEQIVLNCYNSDFYPTDPLCSLFDRSGPDGGIDNVRDSYINIATQDNRGTDLTMTWTAQKAWGTLSLTAQETFQSRDRKALFADTSVDYNGEVGDPKHVGRLDLTVARGPWEYYWGVQYIGPSSNYDSFGGNTTTYRGETVRVVLDTEGIYYHTISASRKFARQGITARFGVANAFDQHPPRLTTLSDGLGEVYTEGNSAFYSQYDWFGRRFYFTLTKTFGTGTTE